MAYQVMTLSATGEAETPEGGSVCMRCRHEKVSGGDSPQKGALEMGLKEG